MVPYSSSGRLEPDHSIVQVSCFKVGMVDIPAEACSVMSVDMRLILLENLTERCYAFKVSMLIKTSSEKVVMFCVLNCLESVERWYVVENRSPDVALVRCWREIR